MLDNFAEGLLVEQIVAEYPASTRDDVVAVLAYAAEPARAHVRAHVAGA